MARDSKRDRPGPGTRIRTKGSLGDSDIKACYWSVGTANLHKRAGLTGEPAEVTLGGITESALDLPKLIDTNVIVNTSVVSRQAVTSSQRQLTASLPLVDRGLTLLELGELPFAELAALANREGFRPRPIYQMHKWFARRLGTSFRALLSAAQAYSLREFWDVYYGKNAGTLVGKTVLDPFVGGGTSLVEASRFGARVIGFDVDPVACLVTQSELEAGALPNLESALLELKQSVGTILEPLYQLNRPGIGSLTVVHWFWVQRVRCGHCRRLGDAHPNLLVAETEKNRTVVCPECGELHRIRRNASSFTCSCSKRRYYIERGNVSDGRYQCTHCGHTEALIDIARRDGKPRFRLFAAEVADMSSRKRPQRHFVRTSRSDELTYKKATRQLEEDLRNYGSWSQSMEIPQHGMGDGRLDAYGYESWLDLFNDRQMLHLRLLERAIKTYPEPIRNALSLAFSAHLPSNCVFASYTAKWRRLTPLFSIRGFRHIARPTELNPWLDGVGRGTYPNAIRKLQRAKEFSRTPREPLLGGGFVDVPPILGASHQVRCVDSSREGKLKANSIDYVLTDPPYFDFIHYAGLASFFSPWLSLLGLTASQNRRSVAQRSLAGRRECEESARRFSQRIGAVFKRVEAVMRDGAMMMFTYRHSTSEGWESIAKALAQTTLEVVQVLPLPGEARSGLHVEEGSSRWDAVLVLKKQKLYRHAEGICAHGQQQAQGLATLWKNRLENSTKLRFTDADFQNLRRALVVGVALGMAKETCDDTVPWSELRNWLKG